MRHSILWNSCLTIRSKFLALRVAHVRGKFFSFKCKYFVAHTGWSDGAMVLGKLPVPWGGGGRVVRWCCVNFQCRGVLQF